IEEAARQRRSETSGRAIAHELATAESLARDLLGKLAVIEERLKTLARLSKTGNGVRVWGPTAAASVAAALFAPEFFSERQTWSALRFRCVFPIARTEFG